MARQPTSLLVKVLVARIGELAKEKGLIAYRVDYKRNLRGELVIALIVPDKDGSLAPPAD